MRIISPPSAKLLTFLFAACKYDVSFRSRKVFIYGLLFICLVNPFRAHAQKEIGHFAPGVFGIRDFIMPDSGLYGALYTYRYNTQRLNDAEGNEIKSVTINPGPGPGVVVNVDVSVAVGVAAPTFIWVSPWKVLGGRYGAYISPSFSNTTVGASLSIQTGSGRSSVGSQFGFGDLLVQPLWLTWNKKHVDFSFAYGFYAPLGKYNTETIILPGSGAAFTTEASDNIGYGFWTNQFQGAASLYPWADRRMAITTALTYELHGKKKDFDVHPGQNLTLNWGISQYLPLKSDQSVLLEIGPAGYNSWQVSEDSGSDAAPGTKDSVHAIGGQVGITQVKWNTVLNFHYFYEFSSKDRFQGESIGLNIASKF